MELLADLGVRVELVIPLVALVSMGAGMLVARLSDRR